jgi:serine O-acetyltransferase
MWSELCADARLYSAFRWPEGAGRGRRLLIWWISPGLLVLAVQRLSHHYRQRRREHGWTAATLTLRALLAVGFPLVVVRAKSDVAASTDIGRDVYLSDGGYLLLGPRRIGSGTLIHARVTIGVRAGGDAAPEIGSNVWIGPDSVIYGAVALGDGATVLPGSVLSMNVAPGSVVGGNPATVVRTGFDNSALRRTLACNIDRTSIEAA